MRGISPVIQTRRVPPCVCQAKYHPFPLIWMAAVLECVCATFVDKGGSHSTTCSDQCHPFHPISSSRTEFHPKCKQGNAHTEDAVTTEGIQGKSACIDCPWLTSHQTAPRFRALFPSPDLGSKRKHACSFPKNMVWKGTSEWRLVSTCKPIETPLITNLSHLPDLPMGTLLKRT